MWSYQWLLQQWDINQCLLAIQITTMQAQYQSDRFICVVHCFHIIQAKIFILFKWSFIMFNGHLWVFFRSIHILHAHINIACDVQYYEDLQIKMWTIILHHCIMALMHTQLTRKPSCRWQTRSTLEIRVTGHSRASKVTLNLFDSLRMVSC